MKKLEPTEEPPQWSADSLSEFASMDSLAFRLERPMLQTELNHTGLEGVYAYSRLLDSASYGQMIREDPQALQALVIVGIHKLGLKLVLRKDDTPVLVVDYVERPSAN
jgi:uncharacterized protein (TIGR03435 family)